MVVYLYNIAHSVNTRPRVKDAKRALPIVDCRLRIVLAGVGTRDFHDEQEDVFEDVLEADMPSAQGLEDTAGRIIHGPWQQGDTSVTLWSQGTLQKRYPNPELDISAVW